jgi:hypothetical protein
MISGIDWFIKIVRIAGVNFPVAASLVQFQAEIDAFIMDSRIKKIEDPISNLHEDVKPFSELLYRKIKSTDSIQLELENSDYIKFSRVIALLASAGYFETEHAAGLSVPIGISLSDPTYIMYLCKLFEHTYKMEELIGLVDSCMIGEWLDGNGIAESIELPLCVVDAVFRIYEAKGLGLVSPDVGESSYLGQA